MKTYTCEICYETYESDRSDEECWAELYELIPEDIVHDTGVVCDDCYIEFMEWFTALTEEEKKKLREDHIKSSYQ